MKNLPKLFYTRLERIYPKEICDKIAEVICKPRNIVSFRVNNLKSNPKEVEEFLNRNSIDFMKIEELNSAYVVDKKYDYSLKWSEIFYSGKIYIQSLSSMIPAIILAPNKWEIILDMTAAPWSKTTQIADLMNNSWEIHWIEQNQIRFDKLNFNINLQWATNVTTYKMDADKIGGIFGNNYFDKILLDVPCSAEWRINLANEKTFGFWSTENIKKKQELQIKLLEKAILLLKKWGTIVYSTCTIAPEENEEVINNILEKFEEIEVEKIDFKFEWICGWITEFNWKTYNSDVIKTLRIIPTSINDWFFVAKLRKI